MNIVIVGGGTAGWLTALYANKVYPEKNIILIESEEIGILGAGEGTTPEFIECLNFLDIPVSDLVKNCQVTIKNGIKFVNWDNNGGNFFHPFPSSHAASNDTNYIFDENKESGVFFSNIFASKFDQNLKDFSLMDKISNKNKVPFIEKRNKINDEVFTTFENIAGWAIHFDARLLAEHLKQIAINRKIKRIEGTVENVEFDENNYINKILVNKDYIDVDFVFDCTGFKRLIIGNFYKSEWKSHSEYLPAKKAIPFFLPAEKEIPPYTEAIAMDYGWMWKIPLQHRYGCGYVFDSDFVSDENAKKEIDEYLGFEVDSPKTFSFNAGCYKEVWINNCMAIGLSAGFIEPLEATSIWQSYILLKDFFSSYNNIDNKDKSLRDAINNKYLNQTQQIVDFLYLHYVTKKNNNNFWKYFIENNKTPDFVENILKLIKERPIVSSLDFYQKNLFNVISYNYVLVGNNIIDKDILKKYYSIMITDKTQEYLNILKNQEYVLNKAVEHKYFLNFIKAI